MTKIDLEQLRTELQSLKRSQPLYYLLRDELGKLGYWKARKRGDPAKAYRVMKGKEVRE